MGTIGEAEGSAVNNMLGGMATPAHAKVHQAGIGPFQHNECSLPGVLPPTEPERGCGLWVREIGADDDLDELVDPASRWLSLL